MNELVHERSKKSKVVDGTARVGIALSSLLGGSLCYGHAVDTLQSPLAASFAFASIIGVGGYALDLEEKKVSLIQQIKNSSQNLTKFSFNKGMVITAVILGYGLGYMSINSNQEYEERQQQFAAEQTEIRKLPALDPEAPLQITVNPREEFCSSADNEAGKAVRVTVNGQQYHLECGLR